MQDSLVRVKRRAHSAARCSAPSQAPAVPPPLPDAYTERDIYRGLMIQDSWMDGRWNEWGGGWAAIIGEDI